MSVKHVVLGLLIERPGYGYELTQRLDERIDGWQPSATAVYPALRALRGEDLVSTREQASETRSAHRNVVWYEATPKGVEHFSAWMSDMPAETLLSSEELLMRIALARAEDMEGLIELTHAQESVCLDRIRALQDTAGSVQPGRSVPRWPSIVELLLRNAELTQLDGQMRILQNGRDAMEHHLESIKIGQSE